MQQRETDRARVKEVKVAGRHTGRETEGGIERGTERTRNRDTEGY